MMVHKDSSIFRIEDLKGKRIAVPNRFSNQRLIIFKALRERGMSIDDVTLLELPPPDMPAALFSKSVDAIISGEPFMAQSEMDGYGRVLFMTKDVWPDFISCVLAVHEDVINHRRVDVQRLVDGIASSGKWLVVVAAEMVAVNSGLGYLIIDARNTGKRYDLVIAGMIVIGLIGLALDLLVRRIEQFDEVRWGYTDR